MDVLVATGRGRTNDPEGLRRQLIDAAYRAFATQGYNTTAVHDIRLSVGASGGAFSHHFRTKKALGLAVLKHRVADAVEKTWIEPVLSAASADQGIQQAFAAIIAALKEQGSVSGCPLNNLALELSNQDAEMREAIDVIFKRWRKAIADKIGADQSVGLLRALDADATAIFVVAAYSGAIAMAKASQDTVPLEACARQLAVYFDEFRAN